jgi:ABC-2 type transport system permease protein
MQMPVFLLLFLAPVFVPRDLLQDWIRTAADYNPLTAFVEAGRDLISGQGPEVALVLAVAAGMVALLGLWSVRGLRIAERAA